MQNKDLNALPPTSAQVQGRYALWQTDAGPVTLTFPAELALHDVEFLEEFVALWIRGLRRRAERSTETPFEGVATTPTADGEGTLGEAKGPTEPKSSNPSNHTEESKP